SRTCARFVFESTRVALLSEHRVVRWIPPAWSQRGNVGTFASELIGAVRNGYRNGSQMIASGKKHGVYAAAIAVSTAFRGQTSRRELLLSERGRGIDGGRLTRWADSRNQRDQSENGRC